MAASLGGLLGVSQSSWQAASQKTGAEAKPPPQRIHRRQPDYNKDPAAAAPYVDKLAMQSHGDINQLPSDDQTFLYGMIPHYAPMMLRERYQYLASKHQTPPPHAPGAHAHNSARGTASTGPKI